ELEEYSPSFVNFKFNKLKPGFTNSEIPNFGSISCELFSLVDLEFLGYELGSDSDESAWFRDVLSGTMNSGYNTILPSAKRFMFCLVSSGAMSFRLKDISSNAMSFGSQNVLFGAISFGSQDVSSGVVSSGSNIARVEKFLPTSANNNISTKLNIISVKFRKDLDTVDKSIIPY
ncbi:17815_t:CDS:2, partial [Gigaspora margarita]